MSASRAPVETLTLRVARIFRSGEEGERTFRAFAPEPGADGLHNVIGLTAIHIAVGDTVKVKGRRFSFYGRPGFRFIPDGLERKMSRPTLRVKGARHE